MQWHTQEHVCAQNLLIGEKENSFSLRNHIHAFFSSQDVM